VLEDQRRILRRPRKAVNVPIHAALAVVVELGLDRQSGALREASREDAFNLDQEIEALIGIQTHPQQIRHQAGDFAAADQFFSDALELLDSSNAHEIAASAYFRYANLLEERGDVQRSLTAIKKAYEHQRLGKRGDLE